jgi:DNA (cytosine-5)-methyltransferase 1
VKGNKLQNKYAGTYIDLFSGCGGLSLGLGNAGWQGLFAVEKDPMAFATFKHNMIDGQYAHFDWPQWLPREATTIQNLLKNYPKQLEKLSGKVDLIAGGPPCQGFSLAGMRNAKDPRNKLSQEYIKMVSIIKPKYILLENVRGFNASFKDKNGKAKARPHSELVKASIEKLGYQVTTSFLNSKDFGVPQSRTRFIMIGVRNDLAIDSECPFSVLEIIRGSFLKDRGLSSSPVSVKEAISDLEILQKSASLVKHSGSDVTGFKQLDYKKPKKMTAYQKLMAHSEGEKPNSLRLARHRQSTVEKFKHIQKVCKPGRSLSDDEKEIIGTKKQSICVLDSKKPSRTLTTLPDDILHYSEPRILTVRESARIQSFPDDFDFVGKYTTGGSRRKQECPRYTQVGNAVPPLLGEALGVLLGVVAGF